MDPKFVTEPAAHDASVSVLFDGAPPPLEREPPSYFRDLNLDQLVDAIIAGREEYDLGPLFYTRLTSVEAVAYRQAVVRDLQSEEVCGAVTSFSKRMREMKGKLQAVEARRYPYERGAWFRDAVATYCDAVVRLADDLASVELTSSGLAGVRDHVARYVESEPFSTLVAEAERVKAALDSVRYCMEIDGPRIRVSRYEDDSDYSAEVLETFQRFKQGAVRDYRLDFKAYSQLNHVEAAVLEMVARLHPEEFALLESLCRDHAAFIDDAIGRFNREIQFYLAYLDLARRIEAMNLRFCLPELTADSKVLRAHDAFDMALANMRLGRNDEVVCNDLRLDEPERIIVVSGPNQGGKTTFARMLGQLHHLAALGCPVPGRSARLYLCDEIYTHFEREEDLATLSGKLEDDLVRIHDILERATPNSVVIMNESFTSTTLQDALVLGRAVMQQMIELDLLCVYVTFVDELASLGETTVSMMSTVVPHDPASRTFKVVRRPADGLAYAAAIAGKYGLAYATVKERVAA